MRLRLSDAARRFAKAAARAAIAIAMVAAARAPAAAGEVKIPLTIDYVMLREALKQQLYTAPGGRADLWKGLNECQFLYAENPEFSRAGAAVKLETVAALSIGMGYGGRCISPVSWNGIAEAETEPYIAPGLRLRFHVRDLNLLNPAHEKTLIVGQAFDQVKQYLIPRLETFTYDLNPAVRQLDQLAENASTPEVAARINAALATVRAEPQVTALDDGVRVTIAITIPEFAAPAAVASPAEPTAAELAAFQKTLEEWDAFLVFAIKQLGETVGDQQFRDQLMSILIESRYRLVAALANPPVAGESDPVRELFLDEWQKLHDAVRAAAKRGMLGARSFEFLSFVSAGDALLAFDQAAPALGMRISAQDLRRLAHIMAPQSTADPLAFSFQEDPELRKLFTSPGVAPPLQSPGPIEETDIGAASLPSATPSPTTIAPLREPPMAPTAPTPASSPTSLLDWMLRWIRPPFAPREALASETGANAQMRFDEQLKEVGQRLKHVVIDNNNALLYREDMASLLELSAEREVAYATDLDAKWPPVYVNLVKSTAWQESCWRQFVRVNGRIRWLESSTGDIGLMQVNKHVWRGFYRPQLLEWDALYNAGAGAEILMRMTRYVIARPVVDPVPVPDHLARSAYAAYNGGPDAYNRWRLAETPAHKQVDDSFWAKYQATKDGQSVDILACAARWGKSPGH